MFVTRQLLRRIKKGSVYLALSTFCVSYIIATHYFVVRYQDENDIPDIWHSTLNLFYPDDTSCYHRKGDYLLPIEKIAVFPDSIFFHETSCQRNLGVREACSIEAATRSHPHRIVHVMFVKPLTEKECFRGALGEINKLNNVRLSRVNISTYALNTPLQNIFNSSLTAHGKRHYRRVAEYLKFLTLHRFGGMVVDLDKMFWEATDYLGSNWAVKEDDGRLGSGIISIAKENLGKRITPLLLDALKDNSNATGIDGGQILYNVLQYVCSASDIDEINSTTTCDGFKIYDSKLFRGFNSSNWQKYSVPGSLHSMSLGYHLWNGESGRAAVHNDSMYADMAKRYCPNIFNKYSYAFVN